MESNFIASFQRKFDITFSDDAALPASSVAALRAEGCCGGHPVAPSALKGGFFSLRCRTGDCTHVICARCVDQAEQTAVASPSDLRFRDYHLTSFFSIVNSPDPLPEESSDSINPPRKFRLHFGATQLLNDKPFSTRSVDVMCSRGRKFSEEFVQVLLGNNDGLLLPVARGKFVFVLQQEGNRQATLKHECNFDLQSVIKYAQLHYIDHLTRNILSLTVQAVDGKHVLQSLRYEFAPDYLAPSPSISTAISRSSSTDDLQGARARANASGGVDVVQAPWPAPVDMLMWGRAPLSPSQSRRGPMGLPVRDSLVGVGAAAMGTRSWSSTQLSHMHEPSRIVQTESVMRRAASMQSLHTATWSSHASSCDSSRASSGTQSPYRSSPVPIWFQNRPAADNLSAASAVTRSSSYRHQLSTSGAASGGAGGGGNLSPTSASASASLAPLDNEPGTFVQDDIRPEAAWMSQPASAQDGSVDAHFADSELLAALAAQTPDTSIDWNAIPLENYGLEQVRGNIYEMSRTPTGSRFMLSKLDAVPLENDFFQMFHNELRSRIADVMMDNYGHCVAEKLVARCSPTQLDQLATSVCAQYQTNMIALACHRHGSFGVQALLTAYAKHGTDGAGCAVLDALKLDVLRLVLHSVGHFALIRALYLFTAAETSFIDDVICANCLRVGTDHQGLRVIKAVLLRRTAADLQRVYKEIVRHTMKFAENQYGNYIIQAALQTASSAVQSNIKVKMEGKFARLAKQKFSSNVVEICLRLPSSQWRAIVIKELIARADVADVLRDRYGNYVLQTALSVASPGQALDMSLAILPVLPSLRENISAKWKQLLQQSRSQNAATTASASAKASD